MKDEPQKNFLDTNILIHASCQRSAKTEKAGQILNAGGIISVQVLNEFASAAFLHPFCGCKIHLLEGKEEVAFLKKSSAKNF